MRTLRLADDGAVVTITMSRSERMNAMTNEMAAEMTEVLEALAGRDDLAAVVVTGEGSRAFCPGADLKQVASGEDDAPISGELFRSAVLLHEMPAVTVAAVNGACAGAGLGWAAACDLRYAARGARFSTAFLDVAVAGDMGLPWSLPRLVGAARARQLSFFPEKFTADQAAAWGLVHEVVDDERLAGLVRERVDRLVAADRDALRMLKANYVSAERLTFGELVALEGARHLDLYAAQGFRDAARRFDGSAR
jgi:2-(1,2-epoxy-1,2-dihydrophenyl)acetyl-CoA isomerase